MATYGKVIKENFYNPYILNGRAMSSMVFYDPKKGEVLCTKSCAWFGSNNDGNSAIEALEYRVRRAPRLFDLEPHSVLDVMYIPSTALEGFIFEPDSHEYTSSDGEVSYGHHITFVCGATSKSVENYTHLTEVKPRRFMIQFTRRVFTGDSKRKKDIDQLFKQYDVNLGYDVARAMLKMSPEDKQKLNDLITQQS